MDTSGVGTALGLFSRFLCLVSWYSGAAGGQRYDYFADTGHLYTALGPRAWLADGPLGTGRFRFNCIAPHRLVGDALPVRAYEVGKRYYCLIWSGAFDDRSGGSCLA